MVASPSSRSPICRPTPREASEEAEELGIKVDQPRIYYGPVIANATDGADYAIVGDNGSDPVEYDTDNSFFLRRIRWRGHRQRVEPCSLRTALPGR